MKLAVILTGGGARAAYQVGVLRYLVDHFEQQFKPKIWCGTSAGAINTAFMAQFANDLKRGAHNLTKTWAGLNVEDVYEISWWLIIKMGFRWVLDALLGKFIYVSRYRSLLNTQPLDRFLRRIIDVNRINKLVASGDLEALTFSATEYGTGKNICFLINRNKELRWQRHQRESRNTHLSIELVMASASIPFFFPAVKVFGIYYGDGSLRDKFPLSPATKLGADKILSIGVSSHRGDFIEPARHYPTMSTIGGALFDSIFLDSLDTDMESLNRINRLIKASGKNIEGHREINAFQIRPSQDMGALAAKYYGELPRIMRHVFRGIGKTMDESSSDFLSYVLFSGSYAKELIELGYRDAQSEHQALKDFFEVSHKTDAVNE